MTTERSSAIEEAAGELSRRLNRVFESLERLRDTVAPILADPEATHTRLARIEPQVRRLLNSHGGFVTNAGVAVAPGALNDVPAWMQSWHRSATGPRLTNHSLNPSSMSYYDYTEMEWFTVPSTTRAPVLHGPYVDFGGVDSRIITAAIPAVEVRGNVSVIAADLGLEELERLLLRLVGSQSPEVAIVTENDTVVASNSARLLVAGMLAAEPAREHLLTAPSLPPVWRLAVVG